MAQKCKNCAWYCHVDGKCYGNALLPMGTEIGLPMDEKHEACHSWTFDGLEEWEREPEEALMAMEQGIMI